MPCVVITSISACFPFFFGCWIMQSSTSDFNANTAFSDARVSLWPLPSLPNQTTPLHPPPSPSWRSSLQHDPFLNTMSCYSTLNTLAWNAHSMWIRNKDMRTRRANARSMLQWRTQYWMVGQILYNSMPIWVVLSQKIVLYCFVIEIFHGNMWPYNLNLLIQI